MLKFICPLICVEDITRSRQFYENILKQKIRFDFGENVTYKGDFAIHLKGHFQELLGKSSQYPVVFKTNNCELYFETDEIDILLKRLEDNGVEFIHKIHEQSWGQRVMRFYDPDGHIIEIGEPMKIVVQRFHQQGQSIETICERTSMPKKFVEQVIMEKKNED